MKRIFFFLLVWCMLTTAGFSQPVGKLYVLNEGAFGGVMGSIGYVDFQAGIYTHIDSVAQFGNQVLLYDNVLYAVDGEGSVLMYDATSGFAPLDTLLLVGARNVQVFDGQLLVAGFQQPYFRSYDIANGYSLRYAFDSTKVASSREEILVVGDKAYVAGFYNDTLLTVIDLVAEDTVTHITTAINNNQLEQIGNSVFVGCYEFTPSFSTHTTVHEINPVNDSVLHTFTMLDANGFTASDDRLILKGVNQDVYYYDPVMQVVDTLAMNASFYGLQFAAQAVNVADYLFFSQTDFTSSGSVGYIAADTMSVSVPTNISPRAFFADLETLLSIADPADVEAVRLFPNPAKGYFQLAGTEQMGAYSVRLFDLGGRVVKSWEHAPHSGGKFSIEGIAAGLYVIQMDTPRGIISKKISISE